MCYEHSSWFRKVRAADPGRAREKVEAAKRAPAKDAEPKRERQEVKEPEKIPA